MSFSFAEITSTSRGGTSKPACAEMSGTCFLPSLRRRGGGGVGGAAVVGWAAWQWRGERLERPCAWCLVSWHAGSLLAELSE